jgi:hypothetical protein
MAAKYSDLVEYFENLAMEHIEIKHSAVEKHFYRFELDEVLTGLAAGINYPALILEAYDFNFNESSSDNIRKTRTGAFMLIDVLKDLKDYDRIHEIWDEMEEIGDDILIKMRADKESKSVPVLRGFNIGSCTGMPLPVIKIGQCGMRFTFNLECAVDNIVDTERWI